ncbi:MAG: hypothetical protein KC416_15460, partial [Myxococcales bacterium]|nr:hypothetical protein [Myxococcales bacterium]
MSFPLRERLAELHPRRFFLETWTRMDEEAEAERAERRSRGLGYDYRPVWVLSIGAVLLTAMEYLGGSATLFSAAHALETRGFPEPVSFLESSSFGRLAEFVWWAGWRVLGYFVVPVILLKLLGERVRDHGLSFAGFRSHAWIYVLAYAVVLVCVVIVSHTDEFSTYYPFYKLSSRSWLDFAAWELLYAAQFFSLEFFFRGFWLKACKTMMGSHAIFAMVVPYCMIHFGKP